MTTWKRADGLSELDILKKQIELIRVIVYKVLDFEKEYECFGYGTKHPLVLIKRILDDTEEQMRKR